MRVLFLHKYGRQAAGYRYRLQQFLPALEKAGIEYTISSLLDDDYLLTKFDTGRLHWSSVARGFLRRLGVLLRAHHYDLVVIYSEILPYFPPVFEHYLNLRGVPYVIDYDDAIFHNYDQSNKFWVRALMGEKVRTEIRGAAAVFAGNEYLARYARAVNGNVKIFPTVVDLERYKGVKAFDGRAPERFTIGWIGSPSTAIWVKDQAQALRRFCNERNARLVLVGSGKIDLSGFDVELRPWSEETELRDIMDFDVGIMPLPDTPWSRGKCGFKLIQYMACGVPVIASPVGVNTEIVDDGVDGFLASDEEDWLRALNTFHANPMLLPKMGGASRERVREHYSLEALAPRFVEGIREIAR